MAGELLSRFLFASTRCFFRSSLKNLPLYPLSYLLEFNSSVLAKRMAEVFGLRMPQIDLI